MRRLRILHAIHDFLPRHRAGSEIYAHDLAVEQARRHDVWVLGAEYDPTAAHATIRWRRYGVLPVIELVNNWTFRSFDETYASPRLNEQLGEILRAVKPDVVHVHNLLNLSLDLPRLARERGAIVVATLHDYTLVCIAGGQRVHREARHVCHDIDPERCARCFPESALGLQFAAGRLARSIRAPRMLRAASAVARAVPAVRSVARATSPIPITPDDVRRRLAYARHVFDMVDVFVAPSRALAAEYVRLGIPSDRIEVSGYGHPAPVRAAQPQPRVEDGPLRIGYVGSIVWHKGLHVLLAAARSLHGEFTIDVHGDLDVDPVYARELRAAAKGLPVRFAGPFDREAIESVYSELDMLVVPSIWPENAPLVVQEAKQYGVPVVASRIGGLPEFVGPRSGGWLFEPASDDDLRRVLQGLIDERSQLARLASGATEVKSIGVDAAEWERRYASLTNLDLDSDLERRAPVAGVAGRD